jgi:hypothetical protein
LAYFTNTQHRQRSCSGRSRPHVQNVLLAVVRWEQDVLACTHTHTSHKHKVNRSARVAGAHVCLRSPTGFTSSRPIRTLPSSAAMLLTLMAVHSLTTPTTTPFTATQKWHGEAGVKWQWYTAAHPQPTNLRPSQRSCRTYTHTHIHTQTHTHTHTRMRRTRRPHVTEARRHAQAHALSAHPCGAVDISQLLTKKSQTRELSCAALSDSRGPR